MSIQRLLIAVFAFALIAASCGDDDGSATDQTEVQEGQETTDTIEEPAADETTEQTAAADDTTDETPIDDGDAGESPFSDEGRSIDAVEAAITVDGDAADWADIEGLELTLNPLSDESAESKEAMVKVAHDADNVYVLLQVDDDYDWTAEDLHLSGASAVQWAIADGAGEGMGATDADRLTSLGLVDIWHWELECAAGAESGGAVSGPGADHDPGNDEACNFDDEYATDTETREDDGDDGAENSLLGVWAHTSDTIDEDGTWTFEMMRPLQTADAQDAQFEIESSALMALAYWDADTGPDGWEAEFHVMSANQGWITVNFV